MEQNTDRNQRRGSIGRAFAKLKDAMKRRSSSSRNVLTTPMERTEAAQTERPTEALATKDVSRAEASTAQETTERFNTEDRGTEQSKDQSPQNTESVPLIPGSGEVIGVSVDERTTETQPATSREDKIEIEDTSPDSDIGSAQYQYVIQQRPRAGMDIVLRPKIQIIRRLCHECQTHFESASQLECQKCGHKQCQKCPSIPQNLGMPAPGLTDLTNEEPKMVAAVQRVYRRPRQRVRWYCDQCQGALVDRRICRGCGHERCPSCVRQPPEKPPFVPDPAVLQSLSDRLAQLGSPSTLIAAAP